MILRATAISITLSLALLSCKQSAVPDSSAIQSTSSNETLVCRTTGSTKFYTGQSLQYGINATQAGALVSKQSPAGTLASLVAANSPLYVTLDSGPIIEEGSGKSFNGVWVRASDLSCTSATSATQTANQQTQQTQNTTPINQDQVANQQSTAAQSIQDSNQTQTDVRCPSSRNLYMCQIYTFGSIEIGKACGCTDSEIKEHAIELSTQCAISVEDSDTRLLCKEDGFDGTRTRAGWSLAADAIAIEICLEKEGGDPLKRAANAFKSPGFRGDGCRAETVYSEYRTNIEILRFNQITASQKKKSQHPTTAGKPKYVIFN